MPDPTPEEAAALAAAQAAEEAAKAKADADAAAAKAKEDEPFDEDRAKRTILAQRESETRLKAELAEARKAKEELDAIKAAQLTESERTAQERDAALAKAEQADRKIEQANLIAALANPELGLASAQAAAKLIEGVTFDEAGEPTNLAERVEALVAANSFLKAPATTTTTAPNLNGGSGGSGGPPPTLTVDEARAAAEAGMDPAYYAAMKDLQGSDNQLETWQRLQEARKAAGAT